MSENGSRTIRDAHGVHQICGEMMKDPPRGRQYLVCGLEPEHDGTLHIAYGTGGRERGTQLAAWPIGT